MDDNRRLKRPAKEALTAMTKEDGRKQCNNQPMTGESKASVGGGGNGDRGGSGNGGGGR